MWTINIYFVNGNRFSIVETDIDGYYSKAIYKLRILGYKYV